MSDSTARPAIAPIDIGRLIDGSRWGGYQAWLLFLTALTIVFDGIDNQLLGISIPTITKEWSVPRAAFAPVVALGYFGMMIGGAAAGVAGDRFGRRTALLGSMVIFGAMTLAAAFTHGVGAFAALRLLAGIGLGGAMPNAAALAAECVPRHRRPLAVTIAIVCVPLGATLAGVLGIRLLPTIGWRMLFILGGVVPVVAAGLLTQLLPESPRFLARHPARWSELVRLLRRMGHAPAEPASFIDPTDHGAGGPPLRALFMPGLRGDTFALWGSFFSCLLAVYLGFSWLPTLLNDAGFSPAFASTGITAFNLGGVAGALAGGLVISRVGSRAAMLTMTAAAIGGAVVLSTMTIAPSESRVPILAMLTFTGGLINAVQTTMFALATNVYPSAIRATGVGTAVAVGRLGAVLSSYAGPWALALHGSVSFFMLMASAMGGCFVALAVLQRHVASRRRAIQAP